MMQLATDEERVLARVVAWASSEELIRAAVLTSTRAVSGAPRDLLSDYDVELFVADVEPFRGFAWVGYFAEPLLRVGDSWTEAGVETLSRMVLYRDGVKIDYTIRPLAILDRVAESGRLPEQLDVGYRVLLDKDDRLAFLPAPTNTAHVPARPTAAAFRALVEEFWFVCTYVAKYLWRGEFLAAKVIFDHELKYLLLRKMLDWRTELDQDWTLAPGFFGRGLQQHVDPATWAEFEATYVGAAPAENWAALFRTVALFQRLSREVAAGLGYDYPADIDALMLPYLRTIQQQER
jgi:aminoglycoside 6-adenylyltransferase